MDNGWSVQCKVDADVALPEEVSRVEMVSDGPAAGDTDEVGRLVLGAVAPDHYSARIELHTEDKDEAWDLGRRWAHDLAAVLSFLGSCRARVRAVSITNAPEKPAAGVPYTSMIVPDKAATVAPPQVVSPQELLFLLKDRPERLRRALAWLHKSRLAQDVVDEFLSLVVAFESMSGLLKPGRTRFWECPSCGRETRQCPACGASTESRMSGADALREFATARMGWSPAEWKNVWDLRSKLLHGQEDVSPDDRREHLPALVPKLEEAVVTAIKMLSGLEADHAPRRLRTRPWFSDACLHVDWVAPQEGEPSEGQDSPDADS